MAGGKTGFTLIEIVLTVVVISIGMLGVMALFESATKGALQADLNVVAVNLIHEKMEQIVVDKVYNGYASIDSGDYPTEGFSGDFSLYSRNTNITEVSSADFTTEQIGSGYKRIDVTVSWGSGPAASLTIPTILSDY